MIELIIFIFVVYLAMRIRRFLSRIKASVPEQQPPVQKQEKSFKDSDIIDAEYYDVPDKKS